MKTFVLAVTVLSPAALSAQALLPPFAPESPPLATAIHAKRTPDAERRLPQMRFALEATRQPLPATDYKLRVVQPPRDPAGRLRIAQPDERYAYKILTAPRSTASEKPARRDPRRR